MPGDLLTERAGFTLSEIKERLRIDLSAPIDQQTDFEFSKFIDFIPVSSKEFHDVFNSDQASDALREFVWQYWTDNPNSSLQDAYSDINFTRGLTDYVTATVNQAIINDTQSTEDEKKQAQNTISDILFRHNSTGAEGDAWWKRGFKNVLKEDFQNAVSINDQSINVEQDPLDELPDGTSALERAFRKVGWDTNEGGSSFFYESKKSEIFDRYGAEGLELFTTNFIQYADDYANTNSIELFGGWFEKNIESNFDRLLELNKNIGSRDSIIDPLVSEFIPDGVEPGSGWDMFIRESVKDYLNAAWSSYTDLNKEELFNTVRSKIPSQLEQSLRLYIMGTDEGRAFVKELGNKNVLWNLFVNDSDDIDRGENIVDFYDNLVPWAAEAGLPAFDAPTYADMTVQKFIKDGYGHLADGQPAYLRNEWLAASAETIRGLLLENPGLSLDDSQSALAVTELMNGLDDEGKNPYRPERLMREVVQNFIISNMSDEDADYLLTRLNEAEDFFTELGSWELSDTAFGSLLLKDFQGIVDNRPDSPPTDQEILTQEMAELVNPLIEGLSEDLKSVAIQKANQAFKNAVALDTGDFSELDIVTDTEFQASVALEIEQELLDTFGGDEITKAFIGAAGGVQEFFNQFPEFKLKDAQEIIAEFTTAVLNPDDIPVHQLNQTVRNALDRVLNGSAGERLQTIINNFNSDKKEEEENIEEAEERTAEADAKFAEAERLRDEKEGTFAVQQRFDTEIDSLLGRYLTPLQARQVKSDFGDNFQRQLLATLRSDTAGTPTDFSLFKYKVGDIVKFGDGNTLKDVIFTEDDKMRRDQNFNKMLANFNSSSILSFNRQSRNSRRRVRGSQSRSAFSTGQSRRSQIQGVF